MVIFLQTILSVVFIPAEFAGKLSTDFIFYLKQDGYFIPSHLLLYKILYFDLTEDLDLLSLLPTSTILEEGGGQLCLLVSILIFKISPFGLNMKRNFVLAKDAICKLQMIKPSPPP